MIKGSLHFHFKNKLIPFIIKNKVSPVLYTGINIMQHSVEQDIFVAVFRYLYWSGSASWQSFCILDKLGCPRF